jgi:mevalonate kinase
MRGWILNSALPLVLAVAGTASLVYSWSYEKEELSRATDEVNRLQRSQLVIDIDEVARDQWIIAFNQELSKSEPNQELLAVTSYGAVNNLLMLQSHMEMRVAKSREQYQQTIAARNALITRAKEFAEAKNYSALAQILNKFQELSRASNSTSRLDDEYFAAVDTANSKVAEIESNMRWWYMAGTAALLLSSLLSSVLLDRSFQRLEHRIASKPQHKRK